MRINKKEEAKDSRNFSGLPPHDEKKKKRKNNGCGIPSQGNKGRPQKKERRGGRTVPGGLILSKGDQSGRERRGEQGVGKSGGRTETNIMLSTERRSDLTAV